MSFIDNSWLCPKLNSRFPAVEHGHSDAVFCSAARSSRAIALRAISRARNVYIAMVASVTL